MLYNLIKYIKQESRENTSLCHLAALTKYYVEMFSLPTITVQYTFNKTVSIHINRNVNKQYVIKNIRYEQPHRVCLFRLHLLLYVQYYYYK